MHNGYNQIYNRMPKPNSKAQAAKAANALPVEHVVCEDCKRGDVTLYNFRNHYYCKDHRPSV